METASFQVFRTDIVAPVHQYQKAVPVFPVFPSQAVDFPLPVLQPTPIKAVDPAMGHKKKENKGALDQAQARQDIDNVFG